MIIRARIETESGRDGQQMDDEYHVVRIDCDDPPVHTNMRIGAYEYDHGKAVPVLEEIARRIEAGNG
jgi:hypothetical protein